ncbi:START domain containing 14 [Pholidichthys leucotaenia]
MSNQPVTLPDKAFFDDFRRQCLSTDNWKNKYDKEGIQVWVEIPPANKGKQGPKVHKMKCQMKIEDVSAATLYDVLLDGEYRREWDDIMRESHDIARLSANADVGYYSWKCKIIKDRDVVTLRSWKIEDDDYLIVNFSVKHPKWPPTKEYVRAVSILTGYYVKSTGPNSCIFIYLSHADPRGSVPKVLVNIATRTLAPTVMKAVHKAALEYPAWKQKRSPSVKPWLYPEQYELQLIDHTILKMQRGDSLENVDESCTLDAQDSEDSS